jgi:hypothetical protein
MRVLGSGTALVLVGGFLASCAAYSYPADCQSLWVERNLYYKNAGFCFDQPRASRYFGNSGCSIRNLAALSLSSSVRKRIDEIIGAEQKLGCAE